MPSHPPVSRRWMPRFTLEKAGDVADGVITTPASPLKGLASPTEVPCLLADTRVKDPHVFRPVCQRHGDRRQLVTAVVAGAGGF